MTSLDCLGATQIMVLQSLLNGKALALNCLHAQCPQCTCPPDMLKSVNDAAMTASPTMRELVTTLSSGSYRCAVGSNSFREMMSIIPATIPNSVPNTFLSNWVVLNSAHPIPAARGSDNPESSPNRNPRMRLPVA
mmetsp:Transcript_28598/g.84234  ORF Transcript_28598/g.84234 Transcript_28598/m.84234 type:complete len:135 (-) Transcript_28598:1469-1873(-)